MWKKMKPHQQNRWLGTHGRAGTRRWDRGQGWWRCWVRGVRRLGARAGGRRQGSDQWRGKQASHQPRLCPMSHTESWSCRAIWNAGHPATLPTNFFPVPANPKEQAVPKSQKGLGNHCVYPGPFPVSSGLHLLVYFIHTVTSGVGLIFIMNDSSSVNENNQVRKVARW